ncbi:ferredoxin/ferredoxin-NADP reductase [Leifsonia xyli subsp. cynodontis DSM 46306]|uniref:Uncharacterized protein n=1 Tax=Leifsonia xyli subsp. cynodontis DSM 46306 TaxID=1389489 RepID=U3P843_LEIXC|nr:hypothetical protein [Leifsonia xyli]AGW42450.1 ferredoxin/ferredoxin-NADP reductase [Leifsonia xyli subsp. cynodontis DSM 46306]
MAIGGVPVPEVWDGGDMVAVDGVRIRWGRTDAYEQPEPGVLTLTLIDRTGGFISDARRIGRPVTVAIRVREATPEQVVFRGVITQQAAKRHRIHNPLTDTDEDVWVVTVTASDTLATLAMAVLPGDALDGWVEGAGGWSEQTPENRLGTLWTHGLSAILHWIQTPRLSAGTPKAVPILHGQAAEAARSVRDLINQAYQAEPLAVPSYDPGANEVTVARFATASPLALTLESGRITLHAPDGQIVPAARVRVNDLTVESTVADAIDVVNLTYWWYGADPALTPGEQKRTLYTQGFIQGRTDQYDPAGMRVLKVDTQFMTFDTTEFVPGYRDAYNRFPTRLLTDILTIVNGLNGRLRPPTLTFDMKRLPLPEETEAVLYRGPSCKTFPSTLPRQRVQRRGGHGAAVPDHRRHPHLHHRVGPRGHRHPHPHRDGRIACPRPARHPPHTDPRRLRPDPHPRRTRPRHDRTRPMTGHTRRYNIPYPDGATKAYKLGDELAALAVGVEAALTAAGIPAATNPPIVVAPTLDARDAHFGIPGSESERLTLQTHGAHTIRTDKGWTERYYATYDPDTNPQGATPAGWYPIPGTVLASATQGDEFILPTGQTLTAVPGLTATGVFPDTPTLVHANMLLINKDSGANQGVTVQIGQDGIPLASRRYTVAPWASGALAAVPFTLTVPVTGRAGTHAYTLHATATPAIAIAEATLTITSHIPRHGNPS